MKYVALGLTTLLLFMTTGLAAAAPASDCKVGNETSCSVNQAKCSTSNDTVGHCTDPASSGESECTAKSCNLIDKYINPLVNLLAVFVGVAVTMSIVIGGIQYASSAGDPSKVSAAKNRIRNAITALLAFMFLYAFLQFLVPGGLFRK